MKPLINKKGDKIIGVRPFKSTHDVVKKIPLSQLEKELKEAELKEMTLRRDHWMNISNSNEKLVERFKSILNDRNEELVRVKEELKAEQFRVRQLENKESEFEQLKEVAKKMAGALKECSDVLTLADLIDKTNTCKKGSIVADNALAFYKTLKLKS